MPICFVLFLMRDRKEVDPDRRKGDEELGVETAIRIYHIKKIKK